MLSPYCERAICDAFEHGRALLKFISPNDAGITGSHQSGFYLPISAWEMYTPQGPEDDINYDHDVRILWQDGRTTDSCVKWYGRKTRHEYRLTRFGRGFPFLTADSVGDMLVLVPVTIDQFRAYVLDLDEDIEQIQVALGVEVREGWGVFDSARDRTESEEECVDRLFREFAGTVEAFPTGDVFSAKTWEALIECLKGFTGRTSDARLMRAIEAEYTLFKLVERRLCEPQILRLFESVDEFLQVAASIMNRRKSRAGRSFENHMCRILTDADVPFASRPDVDGHPDIVIPGVEAYNDARYPVERLFVVGLKTTCKDRWRQVLNEGRRVPGKHLVTLQPGISTRQLTEMVEANVKLIVPQKLHRDFPPDSPMTLMTVERFIERIKATIAA